MSAAEEVASREHIDTDELLDEHVVRAFTAKAAEAALAEAESVMRSAAPNQERFRRAVAQKDGAVTEVVENEPVAEPQEPVKEQKSAEPQEPKRRRGAHFKAEQQDVVREAEEAAEAADDSEKPAKKASDSCRPGRGFAGRAYPVKRQEKVNQVPEVQAEKAVKPAESEVREQKPVDGQTASDTETQGQQPAVEQTGRVLRASLAAVVIVAVAALTLRMPPRM